MKILKNTQQFLTKHEMHKLLAENEHKGEENEETIKYLMKEYCKDEKDSLGIKEKLSSLNLFPFEIFQLINFRPKNLLTLQLIIEEMEERFIRRRFKFYFTVI
ncbi:RNA polymerase III subunit C17 [Tubulinosema ratisbonensis]|uniref:RNA polymerase III subunit C17 n=1 Tax=Tubulinosema ratisbonensis TaxID=291195 RepID=A0A437AQ89_9MICR|nr:RNA polymerase III subunit C17 [Tubulinosema ratisbonensis]